MSAASERSNAYPNRRSSAARNPAAAAMTQPLGVPLPQPASGRRTRRTVDLSPAQHRALDIWQRDTADRLGRARVTGQEVLTALIDQLLTDPVLSARITQVLQSRR